MKVGGQLHVPTALQPGKEPAIPIGLRDGTEVSEKRRNLVTLPGVELPVCSLSLLLRSSAEIRLLGLYHRTPTSPWHSDLILLDKPILYNRRPTFSNLQHKLVPLLSLISYCSAKQKSPLAENTKYHGSVVKKKKGKAIPLQAWGGPEGSRKLRFPDFMTTAQEGGKVVSLTHRPPLPQEIHLALISFRG